MIIEQISFTVLLSISASQSPKMVSALLEVANAPEGAVPPTLRTTGLDYRHPPNCILIFAVSFFLKLVSHLSETKLCTG